MDVAVKFCGLTRPADADMAASLGAEYVGVVFAGGPRSVAPDAAASVLEKVPAGVARVGVFGTQPPEEIERCMAVASLDIAQLHADPDPARVRAVRAAVGRPVWAVLRLRAAQALDELDALAECADAVLLDARVEGALGGTGTRLDWTALAAALGKRSAIPLVLAGGLTPDNVADAVRLLRPDVVDVSSGVEVAPGIKDHAKMRSFADAVRAESAR